MARRVKLPSVTFLSPIRKAEGGWRFQIVQPLGDPINLSYLSRVEAVRARDSMSKMSDTVKVVNPHLFDVIVTALRQAREAGLANK